MSNNEVLLVDIEALISAYHEGLADNIAKNPTDTNVNIGVAQPLTSMEMMLESNLVAADLSIAEYAKSLIEQQEEVILETKNQALSKKEEDFDIKDHLYGECYTTDINGNRKEGADFFPESKDSSLKEYDFQKGTAIYKKRFTNDLNVNLGANLTKAFDERYFGKDGTVKIDGHDLNFGLEKCFDCVVNINLSYAIPALEFTFDFAKLLNKIKELLRQLESDLNPTAMFNMICQFGLNIGKNLICPSNLAGIALLLPNLFAKYSLDLVSLRLDWSVVLGPIIKTIVSAVTSFVENIPRLIVPFIDCAINALRATVRYIQTILSSVENLYNTGIVDPLNRIASAVMSSYQNTKDALEALNIIDTDLEDIEQERGALVHEMFQSMRNIRATEINIDANEGMKNRRKVALKEFENFLEDKYSYLGKSIETLSFEEIKTSLIDFLIQNPNYIGVVLEGYVKEDLEAIRMLEEEKRKLATQMQELKKTQESHQKESIASKKRKKYFRLDLVADNRPVSYLTRTDSIKDAEKKAYATLMSDYRRRNPNARLSNEQWAEQDAAFRVQAKKTAEFEWNANYMQNASVAKSKDKKDRAWGINSKNQNYKRNAEEKFNWHDNLFQKYGIDIENKYRSSDYYNLSKANWAKSANKTIGDWVNSTAIKYLLELKTYVMQVTGNIILAYKGIEKFLGEYVETDLKILGNIQEILHLIRFIRLVAELFSSGLTDCDKIKENKEVFKSILNETNQQLLFDDSMLEKENLDPEDYIALKTKDGRYSTIIDLNDCSDAMNHIQVNENNLDSIYEGILNGIYS